MFYNCTDANTALCTWKEIFLEIADIHAPVLEIADIHAPVVKSEYNPWMTKEIKNMSYHREKQLNIIQQDIINYTTIAEIVLTSLLKILKLHTLRTS